MQNSPYASHIVHRNTRLHTANVDGAPNGCDDDATCCRIADSPKWFPREIPAADLGLDSIIHSCRPIQAAAEMEWLSSSASPPCFAGVVVHE